MKLELIPVTRTCPRCGEAIRLLVDPTAGEQQYIEDCPVCCRPVVLTVTLDEQGWPRVDARGEDEA